MDYKVFPGLTKEDRIKFNARVKNPIIHLVAKFYNISVHDIKGRSRKPVFIEARIMISYFLKSYSSMSLVEIGSELGNKHHTTILYYIQQYNDRTVTERSFKKKSETLTILIKEKIQTTAI